MKQTKKAIRHRIVVRGAVQGVGYRPFVHNLAAELKLHGWVSNTPQGVVIEVEGDEAPIESFEHRLEEDRPEHAAIYSMETIVLDPTGYSGEFEIHESNARGPIVVPVMPDIATCPECLREIRDPDNRRFRYPFTNCTHCGPRFSIVESLPYDRPNTTMRAFELCERCRAEYENPRDRRFHAQPIACPECGPWLEWWDGSGTCLTVGDNALRRAAAAIRDARVVAVKGLGGFQLMVDARDETAVTRLRKRKHRDEKPFAVMAPSMDWVRAYCEVGPMEARLLASPQAPIVLLRRNARRDAVAESVAPGNPFLGVMLPYTPLHHLLLDELGLAVVATSGNIAEEPIITDEHEALDRLMGIADMYLVHNRPIARHVDDSVARIAAGREMIVRRARGYAPLPVPAPRVADTSILGLGAHQKNAVGLSVDGAVVVGQHIGDLATSSAFAAMRRSAEDLTRLYARQPELVACDAHPDYLSTRYAESLVLTPVRVQHHHAHVVSCAVENELDGPFLGVAWDGTGYGDDGSVWGGEFLKVDATNPSRYERVARLRPFRLPGGERAVREPRRSAMGVLYALYGEEAFDLDVAPYRSFSETERRVVSDMLRKGLNSPVTTSAGRLFDAVASLLGVRQVTSFEGQAAMELEHLAHRSRANARALPFRIVEPEEGPWIVDWADAIRAIIEERAAGTKPEDTAAAFHNALADVIVAVAGRADMERVVLSGGCFQNVFLLERAVTRIGDAGGQPYWHQRIPTNDGGIALGQIAVAAARRDAESD